jgi:hypothetical protein
VATITTTNVRYYTGTSLAYTNSAGVWSDLDTVLTITLGTEDADGVTKVTVDDPHALSITLGPKLRSPAEVRLGQGAVSGTASRF